jgi:hypothetical protein
MTARISSRVKSGCLAIRAKIQSECSSNGETLPPLRFGAALPVSLQRWHHRITELTPTLKISAISRRDAPLSTASTARSRKSVEYGLGIDLAPQANQFPQIRLGDSGWESLRFNADGKCSNSASMMTTQALQFDAPVMSRVSFSSQFHFAAKFHRNDFGAQRFMIVCTSMGLFPCHISGPPGTPVSTACSLSPSGLFAQSIDSSMRSDDT